VAGGNNIYYSLAAGSTVVVQYCDPGKNYITSQQKLNVALGIALFFIYGTCEVSKHGAVSAKYATTCIVIREMLRLLEFVSFYCTMFLTLKIY
jgi:hypothetical protein